MSSAHNSVFLMCGRNVLELGSIFHRREPKRTMPPFCVRIVNYILCVFVLLHVQMFCLRVIITILTKAIFLRLSILVEPLQHKLKLTQRLKMKNSTRGGNVRAACEQISRNNICWQTSVTSTIGLAAQKVLHVSKFPPYHRE